MKYSEDFTKKDYSIVEPIPIGISVRGKKCPPDGDEEPRKTGGILLNGQDDMPVGLSNPIGGNPAGDFGPFVQRCGEGLPNSFTLDFTNDLKFSPGNVHPHTGLLMYALGLNLRPKVIIETGTFFGYSTMYLAKICETWGEGKVYTFDCNDKLVEQEIKDNPYIEFIHGYSHVKLPILLNRVGEVHMAFIDAWKRQCFQEFKMIEPNLAEGGIVVFHDTQFLNTGRTLYETIMRDYSDRYDTMFFSAFAHKDNPHKFFGNADDRGLMVIRKKPKVDMFYDVPDYASRQYGRRLVDL